MEYLLFVEQQRRTSKYQQIYAADETAVYLDYSSSMTVEEKGAKEVSCSITSILKLWIFAGFSQDYRPW